MQRKNRKQYEIRRNPDGTLDEIVSSKVKHFHLEQMGNDHWWFKLDLEDGSGVHVNITGKKLKILVEEE